MTVALNDSPLIVRESRNCFILANRSFFCSGGTKRATALSCSSKITYSPLATRSKRDFKFIAASSTLILNTSLLL